MARKWLAFNYPFNGHLEVIPTAPGRLEDSRRSDVIGRSREQITELLVDENLNSVTVAAP